VIVFDAAGLKRLMILYCSYYERSPTHLSLDKSVAAGGSGCSIDRGNQRELASRC
jgi:hypothetical protein